MLICIIICPLSNVNAQSDELSLDNEIQTLEDSENNSALLEEHDQTNQILETSEPIYEPIVHTETNSNGEVILEKQTDYTGSYKQHRNRWGVLFSVNYENFKPVEYLSLAQNKNYKGLMGNEGIPVVGIELGLKYNFVLGSLTALFGYGAGSTGNEANGVDNVGVKITKFALNYAVDNIMEEPYVVPYIQGGVHLFDWSEGSYAGNVLMQEDHTTAMNFHFKAGLSFQLNWIERSIDKSTHVDALHSSGLQNTYLDVFYTSYFEPAQVSVGANMEGDPNLKSDEIGVGLKMEF